MSDQESWDDIAAPMVASSDEEGSLGSVGAASPIFSESEGSHASWLEVQAAPLEDQAPVGDAAMAITTDMDNISSTRKEDLKRRRGRPSKADRLVDALVSTDPAPLPVSAPCKNLSVPCKNLSVLSKIFIAGTNSFIESSSRVWRRQPFISYFGISCASCFTSG